MLCKLHFLARNLPPPLGFRAFGAFIPFCGTRSSIINSMNFMVPTARTNASRCKVFLSISVVCTLFLICGCVKRGSGTNAQAAPSPVVAGRSFTSTDLKKLRWIEGTWRGTGGGVAPFVERYKFEGDTTLAVETLEGEKFDKVTDVTRFELKDGEFGGGSEGSRYVATSIDDKSVTFEPVAKARNSFRWEYESENSWKAILTSPATDKGPAKQRIYQMERWPKP